MIKISPALMTIAGLAVLGLVAPARAVEDPHSPAATRARAEAKEKTDAGYGDRERQRSRTLEAQDPSLKGREVSRARTTLRARSETTTDPRSRAREIERARSLEHK